MGGVEASKGSYHGRWPFSHAISLANTPTDTIVCSMLGTVVLVVRFSRTLLRLSHVAFYLPTHPPTLRDPEGIHHFTRDGQRYQGSCRISSSLRTSLVGTSIAQHATTYLPFTPPPPILFRHASSSRSHRPNISPLDHRSRIEPNHSALSLRRSVSRQLPSPASKLIANDPNFSKIQDPRLSRSPPQLLLLLKPRRDSPLPRPRHPHHPPHRPPGHRHQKTQPRPHDPPHPAVPSFLHSEPRRGR